MAKSFLTQLQLYNIIITIINYSGESKFNLFRYYFQYCINCNKIN